MWQYWNVSLLKIVFFFTSRYSYVYSCIIRCIIRTYEKNKEKKKKIWLNRVNRPVRNTKKKKIYSHVESCNYENRVLSMHKRVVSLREREKKNLNKKRTICTIEPLPWSKKVKCNALLQDIFPRLHTFHNRALAPPLI